MRCDGGLKIKSGMRQARMKIYGRSRRQFCDKARVCCPALCTVALFARALCCSRQSILLTCAATCGPGNQWRVNLFRRREESSCAAARPPADRRRAAQQGRHWVLPRGKLKRDENPIVGASREAVEETGHRVKVHEFLGAITYRARGRPKLVQFWRMQAAERPSRDVMKDIIAVGWLPLRHGGAAAELSAGETISAARRAPRAQAPPPQGGARRQDAAAPASAKSARVPALLRRMFGRR